MLILPHYLLGWSWTKKLWAIRCCRLFLHSERKSYISLPCVFSSLKVLSEKMVERGEFWLGWNHQKLANSAVLWDAKPFFQFRLLVISEMLWWVERRAAEASQDCKIVCVDCFWCRLMPLGIYVAVRIDWVATAGVSTLGRDLKRSIEDGNLYLR